MKNNKQTPKTHLPYKITELKPVSSDKYGKVIINHKIEPHEKETIFHLASFGYDIETIMPSGTPHSRNPDIFMLGSCWEIKAPQTSNEQTIKKRFRKAVKQSRGRVVFDLRNIRKESDVAKAEEVITKLFVEITGMRRTILIEKSGKTLEIMR